MLSPIAESSTAWTRHSAPDLRETNGTNGEGNPPSTFVCRTCRSPISSDLSIVSRVGFRGYKGKAVLSASTMNTTLARPSILLMDTGAHTVQELACASCAACLGWKIVRGHELSEQWKEGRFLLELELLDEIPTEEPEALTPVRLHPPTPVSNPTTPEPESPPARTALRPLPVPAESPPLLRPLPIPMERRASAELDDAVAPLTERVGKGHRRTGTDLSPSSAARGRPIGPRSLTPTIGRSMRTLSAYSQA